MKPILFNTDMVRALLEGRKTVTRRVVKSGEHTVRRGGIFPGAVDGAKYGAELDNHGVVVAPYQPGDILYVRETWSEWTGGYVYKADGADSSYPLSFVDRWYPSIHMPKEAARIFLRVTGVRVEQLQEISNQGARQEGCGDPNVIYYNGALQCMFADLWDSTVKPADLANYGWAANPWVWVISFERCQKPEACPI